MTDHDHHHDGHGGHGEGGTMGVHGMLLFGGDALYLSHLPMFASPHNFQVILEVGFDDAASAALRADGDGLHTFEPAVFPITELDPGGDGPTRSSIPGTIYRGHFERGGAPIATGAVAEVHQVVCFDELDVEAKHAPDRDLGYLCFGRAGQFHLAHRITARPDFDQLLTVELVPGTVTDPAGRPIGEEVTGGFDHAEPVLVRGRTDTPEDRLAPGETAGGFFFATSGPNGSHGFAVQLAIGRELYLELAELGSR
jgi:hypothetical protein